MTPPVTLPAKSTESCLRPVERFSLWRSSGLGTAGLSCVAESEFRSRCLLFPLQLVTPSLKGEVDVQPVESRRAGENVAFEEAG